MNEVILDVREKDEFDADHVEYSINVPLSQFASLVPRVLDQLRERNVLLMCRSGKRARLAAEQISQMGYSDKIKAKVFEGGILEWKKRGNPTLENKKNHLPIMRQVQLVAGSTVLAASILGAFVHPGFLALSAFFGAGLTVAGATGFCGMAEILARMPWNKTHAGVKDELCQVSPRSGSCCNS